MKNLLLISIIALLGNCITPRYHYKLSDFNFNGKSYNRLIETRKPKYGDGNRDGCIIMHEITLDLKYTKDQELTGTIMCSENEDLLANAQIKIAPKNLEPLIIYSDQNGHFRYRPTNEIDEITIDYIGYRTLTIDMSKIKI